MEGELYATVQMIVFRLQGKVKKFLKFNLLWKLAVLRIGLKLPSVL
jgi:hypothetical protein